MTGAMKYFYDLMSPPSRALYILFTLEKIPFESNSVALRKGEHLTEDYKKNVNKFQKLPVIHDNGFVLTESVAILRYLSGKGLVSSQWYPTDIIQRARVDEYLEWQHNTLALGSGLYFMLKWVTPLMTGKDADPKRVAEAKRILEGALDLLETTWLADSKFVSGDRPTIADLFASSSIEQSKVAGFKPTEGRKKVENWMQEVRKAANPIYDEAHKFAYKNAALARL